VLKACVSLALACGIAGIAGLPSAAGAAPVPSANVTLTNPGAGHPYRFGALPQQRRTAAAPGISLAPNSSSLKTKGSREAPSRNGYLRQGHPIKGLLTYGGGYAPLGDAGVVTTQPRVYLVFWGSQWGTESTSGGYQVFSGDPNGMAPFLEAFFSGLGTNNELWSATATQYCEGIATNSATCPSSAAHVPYPSGGVLAGVWEDTSITPPTGPPSDPSTPGVTGTQIAQEAANAAAHFNDSSDGAQYVIVSPTGTNPDGWSNLTTGYCAYHDDSGNPYYQGAVTGADVPFTNLPYIPDSYADYPTGCSGGQVPTPNDLEGVTYTAAHEYYETLTDPYPATGWTDSQGYEVADKCDYLNAGLPGAETSLVLSTGSFPVPGMWSNDLNKGKGGCTTSHPLVVVAGLAKQHAQAGVPVSLQIVATDYAGSTLSYSASGLPTGLSIDPGSGLISGTPQAAGSFTSTVVASDGVHPAGSTSIIWKVKKAPRA